MAGGAARTPGRSDQDGHNDHDGESDNAARIGGSGCSYGSALVWDTGLGLEDARQPLV